MKYKGRISNEYIVLEVMQRFDKKKTQMFLGSTNIITCTCMYNLERNVIII